MSIFFEIRQKVRESGKEDQAGGDKCIHMANSHCCTAETNIALKSNFNPIKNKIDHTK